MQAPPAPFSTPSNPGYTSSSKPPFLKLPFHTTFKFSNQLTSKLVTSTNTSNPSSTKLWPRNTWHTTSRCSTHLHTPIPTHNPHPQQHRVHANVCAALHLPSSSLTGSIQFSSNQGPCKCVCCPTPLTFMLIPPYVLTNWVQANVCAAHIPSPCSPFHQIVSICPTPVYLHQVSSCLTTVHPSVHPHLSICTSQQPSWLVVCVPS